MTLKDMRRREGWTLAELARRSGLYAVNLAKWEAWDFADPDGSPKTSRNPLRMTFRSAHALAGAFGISMDQLYDALTDEAES